MKPSDPLLLADDTLRCAMYLAGKVAISRHLATHEILTQIFTLNAKFIPLIWMKNIIYLTQIRNIWIFT
jgi:hypothetical protein